MNLCKVLEQTNEHFIFEHKVVKILKILLFCMCALLLYEGEHSTYVLQKLIRSILDHDDFILIFLSNVLDTGI